MGRSSASKRKKMSKWQKIVILLLCLALLGGAGATLFVTGEHLSNSYHQSVALAQTGARHLSNAEALLKTLPKQPLNVQAATQAQQEFSSALTSFSQLDTTLQTLPGAITWIPQVASPLGAASRLVPLAISGSQAGIIGCQLLELLMNDFHTIAKGFTMANMVLLDQKVQVFVQALDTVIVQARQVKPSDLQLDSRLGPIFASFQKQIPTIQNLLSQAGQILTVAPALLGISSPAHYLLEVLDSTELRPGGGFIGSYGVIDIAGAHLVSAPITDTSLLDHAYEAAGGRIPYPSAYSWFDIAPTWSLRDSNLDADFPTIARYAEENYKKEGGKGSFQGVIAITPALIQQIFAITGPISVPEYNQKVTAQNLISLIHYYQLGDPDHGSGDVPSSDGYSSQRKHFTALLAKDLFDRIQAILPTTLQRFLQTFQKGLQTKDIQIYLNSDQAESLLQSYHLDASIQPTPYDGLFVVDANIAATKANQYIISTLADKVTLDAQGNAVHDTTINYAWTIPGTVDGNPVYRDYVRVYAPPGSTLQVQQGWQPRGTSTAFGHTVWAGFFTLTFGQKLTVTLQWTDHNAAKKEASGWHYEYLIQRQPGSEWAYNLQVEFPSCATIRQTSGGIEASGKQLATVSHSLDQNTNFAVNYTC